MHFAFVLTAVSRRSALEPGPIDFEWLSRLSESHEVELFVDQATPASEDLRRAGVPVAVSLKRPIEEAQGRRVSADGLQARALKRSHERAPFDAIVYGSDTATDLAWLEPDLRAIPRGVALGAGVAHELRTVWEDRELFALLGHRIWSLTGLVSSADFLLSDVAPEAFGWTDVGSLPPRYSTGVTTPEAPSSLGGSWIAVAATTVGSRGAEDLVRRVVERIPPENGTTYMVLTRPHLATGRPIEKALLEDCPESWRRRIVVAAAGDDGVADDFLAAADLVIAASPAELAVPAIADAARRKGLVLLDPPRTASEPAGTFPESLPRRSSHSPEHGPRIVTWDPPSASVVRVLEELGRDVGDDELVVIHSHAKAGPVVRLLGLEGLRGVDLVVWGCPDGVLGHPDPGRLYPHALAVRGAALPAVARAIGDCESIWQLVCWATSGEWIDRLRLLVLPAPIGSELWERAEVSQVAATWKPEASFLPAPRWLAAFAGAPAPSPPPPVQLPRRRFLPPARDVERVGLQAWVRRSRWLDRARLVLPWRWGLLERAMEGRW